MIYPFLFSLAKLRQQDLLRAAQDQRIDLGPFQDEEEELLALERERRLRAETPTWKRAPIAVD